MCGLVFLEGLWGGAVGGAVGTVPVGLLVFFGDCEVAMGTAEVVSQTVVLVQNETSFRDPGETILTFCEPRGMSIGFCFFCGCDGGAGVGGLLDFEGESCICGPMDANL